MSIRRSGNTASATRRGIGSRPVRRNLPKHPPRLSQDFVYVTPLIFTIGVSIIGGWDEIGAFVYIAPVGSGSLDFSDANNSGLKITLGW